MNGVIIIDKPLGKTSFDMIRDIRKKYGIKKVGHIGTLDPMATGVLPVLIGEATKLSDYLMEHDKEYISVLQLGEKRDTGDSEGKVVETKEVPKDISKEKIIDILNSFLGESNQIPPMYSAIKINGKKLYDLAREGKEVERTPRKIKISEIELMEKSELLDNDTYKICKVDNKEDLKVEQKLSSNEIAFRVICSKGTYIRVLCEDIAERLGTVGYMKYLRRTRVGNFKIEDAGKIIEMKDILTEAPKIELNNIEANFNEVELMKKLINGVGIKVKEKDGLVNLYKNGDFIGIGQVKNKNLKRKILIDIINN